MLKTISDLTDQLQEKKYGNSLMDEKEILLKYEEQLHTVIKIHTMDYRIMIKSL